MPSPLTPSVALRPVSNDFPAFRHAITWSQVAYAITGQWEGLIHSKDCVPVVYNNINDNNIRNNINDNNIYIIILIF